MRSLHGVVRSRNGRDFYKKKNKVFQQIRRSSHAAAIIIGVDTVHFLLSG